MRTFPLSTLCLAVLAVGACAKTETTRTDSSAGAVDTARATTAAPAASINLADVAGTWNVVARPTEGKDTSATHVTLTAKGDTTGWTMHVGNSTVPLHVSVQGDSITTASDRYPSARRKGVMVTTHSTYRLENGKLVGTTVAHYAVKTADSVLVLHSEATRAP